MALICSHSIQGPLAHPSLLLFHRAPPENKTVPFYLLEHKNRIMIPSFLLKISISLETGPVKAQTSEAHTSNAKCTQSIYWRHSPSESNPILTWQVDISKQQGTIYKGSTCPSSGHPSNFHQKVDPTVRLNPSRALHRCQGNPRNQSGALHFTN